MIDFHDRDLIVGIRGMCDAFESVHLSLRALLATIVAGRRVSLEHIADIRQKSVAMMTAVGRVRELLKDA